MCFTDLVGRDQLTVTYGFTIFSFIQNLTKNNKKIPSIVGHPSSCNTCKIVFALESSASNDKPGLFGGDQSLLRTKISFSFLTFSRRKPLESCGSRDACIGTFRGTSSRNEELP